MAEWLMLFVLAGGVPFAGGPYTREDCLELAGYHRAKFASNAWCVHKDNPYRRLSPTQENKP